MKKAIITIFIINIMLISGATSAIFAKNIEINNEKSLYETDQKPVANWTVMYYICGETNINDYVDDLLKNLSTLGSDSNLNIVCLIDKIGHGNSKLVYIDETGNIVNLNEEYGWPNEIDTSNLNTLELFCTQMMHGFPAKYYGLVIFASAGIGWQGYYIGDKDGNVGSSKLSDFANALGNVVNKVGHKIDVLFGSCAVNMIEIAYELKSSTNYLVGTQDCLPHTHVIPMFFDAISELKNNTSLNPEGFAIKGPMHFKPVSFIYQEGYGRRISIISKILDKLPFTKLHCVYHHSNYAAINITMITNLTKELNELTSYLLLSIHDNDTYCGIKKSRTTVSELGKCSAKFYILNNFFSRNPFEFLAYDCYIDLYDLIRLFKQNIPNEHIKSRCDLVLETINKTIPYVAENRDTPNCGISIYYPDAKYMYNKYKFIGKIPYPYEDLKFSEDALWDEFLKEYLRK